MTERYVEPHGASAANATPPALIVRNLEKVFGNRGGRAGHAADSPRSSSPALTQALAGLSFDVARGEFVSIMGPSGSGKTTLLNCISTIDRPTRGTIIADGQTITTMSRRALAAFRRESLGFVFQDANLLDTLTGAENIALALTIRRIAPKEIADRTATIAEALGIGDVLAKYPTQMSGGQRQRLAAARAIVGHPSLILADEPTGALDSRNAMVMLETLERMNRMMGATILMVTHDAFAASYTSRVLFLKDGRLFNELRRGTMERDEFFARIMEVIAFLSGDAGVGTKTATVADAAANPGATSANPTAAFGSNTAYAEARHDL